MAHASARNVVLLVAALATPAALAQPCPEGRSITNDTLGHCCWPGQVYSTSRGVCVGVPTSCPSGYAPKNESCEPACPDGMKVSPDTHGVCCWPGQAYSLSRRACVGVPTGCPPGLSPSGESCAFTPAMMPEPMPSPRPEPSPSPAPAPAPNGSTPLPAPPEGPPPPEVGVPEPPAPAPPGPAPTTPPPAPAPPVKPPGPVPLEAAPAAPPTPPPEAPTAEPARTRLALTAGVFTGVGLGGAIGLPIRIGLYTLNPRQPLQGVAALAIEPWVFGSWRSNAGANYLGLGLGLNLGAGWEQRLGPVELFPRVGLAAVLAYQGVVSGGNGNATDLLIRALFGLRFAVPAREGTRFILGLDFYAGANSLWIAYLGVGF